MAGGYRLSCTFLGIQDHGLLVGASCRPIEPAWLQCCQTNLSALNKGTAPPALLLSSSFWERSCVQAMPGREAGREEEHWWALQVSCHAATAACARAHFEEGDLLHYTHGCCFLAIFSCWVWDSVFCFFFFPWKEERKRSVSLHDIWNT